MSGGLIPGASPFDAGNLPPSTYERARDYEIIIRERDVTVPMRDGLEIVVDVYRPEGAGPLPALLAFSAHSKEIQGPDLPTTFPAQPAWSALWVGHLEAGDTRFFVSTSGRTRT